MVREKEGRNLTIRGSYVQLKSVDFTLRIQRSLLFFLKHYMIRFAF